MLNSSLRSSILLLMYFHCSLLYELQTNDFPINKGGTVFKRSCNFVLTLLNKEEVLMFCGGLGNFKVIKISLTHLDVLLSINVTCILHLVLESNLFSSEFKRSSKLPAIKQPDSFKKLLTSNKNELESASELIELTCSSSPNTEMDFPKFLKSSKMYNLQLLNQNTFLFEILKTYHRDFVKFKMYRKPESLVAAELDSRLLQNINYKYTITILKIITLCFKSLKYILIVI
ncbi:hypothetical protein AGLY_005491 [Aphis glycines]|uniref:Uncharacterized protein n=1 Tax=Aphis glycines TaxID=307491 RepID=A0A6G0TWG4_APHGL|nr:hypothetical protein AGLY_005491 [Aphis glycines]